MRSVSARLLILWLVGVVAATLSPFSFVSGAGLEHGLKLFEYGGFPPDPIHFLLNALLFLPLGVLLHHAARSRSSKLPSMVILAGIAGLGISVTIEFLQAFLPTRDSSLIDVVANTVGSLVGVAADRRWGASAQERFARMRAATSSSTLAGLLVGYLVMALLISGALQTRTRLSNWSPQYPLLIGNEQSGDRPWRGRLFALDITDAATPAATVHRFSAGEPVSLTGAAVGTFAFDGKAPYKDASGIMPDLDWTDQPNESGQGGVWLSGRSWLRSVGSAAELTRRLQKTNAFSLRIQCATDDTGQEGPARIVSNSVSPLLRNLTVGQHGSDLVVRLRTPGTGLNGHSLEAWVPGVFADRSVREILATYDGATLLVTTAHGLYVSRTELTPGVSLALAFPSSDILPDETQRYEMAYVAALSLIPGALISFLGHTGHRRRDFSVAWVLTFAVLLEFTMVRVSGSSFDWIDVADAVGVGGLVLAILNAIVSGIDGAWSWPGPACADTHPTLFSARDEPAAQRY